MHRLFDSGIAFILVALLSFLAGIKSGNYGIWMPIGGIWLIIAFVVRRRRVNPPRH